MSERDELASMLREFTGSSKRAAEKILSSEWLAEIKAEEWDEGFEKGATWQPSGPSGIPSDPPRNPHRREAGMEHSAGFRGEGDFTDWGDGSRGG